MHAAHSTSNWAGSFDGLAVVLDREVMVALDGEVVVVLVLAALDVVEVVVLLTDATPRPFELPPHPATRIPLASAAAASRRARGETRISRVGWMLPRIGLLRVCLGFCAHAFYAEGGYRKVSLLQDARRSARVQRSLSAKQRQRARGSGHA